MLTSHYLVSKSYTLQTLIFCFEIQKREFYFSYPFLCFSTLTEFGKYRVQYIINYSPLQFVHIISGSEIRRFYVNPLLFLTLIYSISKRRLIKNDSFLICKICSWFIPYTQTPYYNRAIIYKEINALLGSPVNHSTYCFSLYSL